MMVSTKGRYAILMMIDLAEHQNEGHITLHDVACRQGISEKYLESISKILVSDHLLVGQRGKGGGYRLTRTPDCYTIGSILRLTEGSLAPVNCVDPGQEICNKTAECRMMPMWQRLDELINGYLDSVTLEDLMAGAAGRDGQAV